MSARATILIAVTLMSGFGSTAVAAASGEQQISTTKPPKPERVVCRRESVAGSHIKRRVCRTESQIRQDRVDARHELEQMQAYRNAQIREQTQGR